MSTNELAAQPTVAVENYHEQDESEYAIPDVKSGVRVDPDAIMRIPNPKFAVDDIVHMAEVIDGARVKSTCRVYNSRYNREGRFTEYQLRELDTKSLHNRGNWYREKDLRMDRRS